MGETTCFHQKDLTIREITRKSDLKRKSSILSTGVRQVRQMDRKAVLSDPIKWLGPHIPLKKILIQISNFFLPNEAVAITNLWASHQG